MAAPRTGVCSAWATTADLCDPCSDYELDATLLDDMLEASSNLLYALLGRQWPGSCTETVRPCSRYTSDRLGADQRRALENAGWQVMSSCGCHRGDRCGCSALPEVDLGLYPVVSVTQVRIDGAVLDPAAYRIDDWSRLVRVDGSGWPCCQDLTGDPASDPDTFDVTFVHGVDPPAEAVHAAAVLACELVLSCQPETAGKCRLPNGVQTLVRQGVTEELIVNDSLELFRAGLTGIPEVDLVIAAHNPSGLRRPPSVLSPDFGGPAVRRAGT